LSGLFKPRLNVLPPEQRRLWPLLQPASHLGFVLYGGAAIALRLGHRVSVDFDFFASQPLEEARVRAALLFMARATVLQSEPDTLTVLAPVEGAADGSVKLLFFGGIGFGRVSAPDLTEDGVMRVASLDDLLATKLKVMLQRVEARDYRDVAAMLDAGVNLAAALAAARFLYGVAFQLSESLKALVYFQGGDLATLSDSERRELLRAVQDVRDLPQVSLASPTLDG
jgi:hypothetical protein